MSPTKNELILAVLVMMAIPILAEKPLRLGNVQFDEQLYIRDQGRGWTLRPGASGLASVETKQ
jgi:hypothetical protein